MASLRDVGDCILRCRPAFDVCDLPAAGPSALQSFALLRRARGHCVEHVGVVRHEYELAVLFGRSHHVLPVADGRTCGAKLPVRGGWNGRGRRSHPRVRPQGLQDHRQLLGRSGARHRVRAVADRVCRRNRLHRSGRRADVRWRRAGAQRTRWFRPGPAARPDRLTGGDQAIGHQRRRFFNANGADRSKTPPVSPTSCRSCSFCASRSH